MPNAPKKQKRPWQVQSKPFERDRANEFDYNGRQWRNLAKAHKAANPLCVECLKQGVSVPVAYTDHVVPVKQYKGSPYDESNLQSLCKACHNAKSGRERHL